jgi:putative Mg2+ transporter-C (MgtC) family protein
MDTLRQFLDLAGPHGAVAHEIWRIILRLALAAILGGLIGLERETKHKPAGLRTQMLMCFGAAFFTILSHQIAAIWGGDHTRIAAQIIPGIGFIGAGSILRAGGSVTGLTTAATVFVVASIGMAVGGGFLIPAVFATVVLIGALLLLGVVENRLGTKTIPIQYEVVGEHSDSVIDALNKALQQVQHSMQMIRLSRVDSTVRVQFDVDATAREHKTLLDTLRKSPLLSEVKSSRGNEKESF